MLILAWGFGTDNWSLFYLLPALGFFHGITHLSTYWSAHFKAAISLGRAAGPDDAEFVCCVPDSEQGASKALLFAACAFLFSSSRSVLT